MVQTTRLAKLLRAVGVGELFSRWLLLGQAVERVSLQIKSVESGPMTGLPGKYSHMMPSARPEESAWPGARGWYPKY